MAGGSTLYNCLAPIAIAPGCSSRLVALSTNVIRFVGFEREEDAWVMQEWECELLKE